jgi:transposase
MPNLKLTHFILLPKLNLLKITQEKKTTIYFCESNTKSIWCHHCGLECFKVHDKRTVQIKDAPNLDKQKTLVISKKRFRCCGCKKVLTETLPGIKKGARLTERMQRHLLYMCNKFSNMKDIRKHFKLGNKTIYQRQYKQLELEWNKRKNDVWPKNIGIDEHSFIRNKKYGRREFVSLIVDHSNKRAKEVVPGRTSGQLKESLSYIPGKENVKNITMDLSPTYRSFAKDFFPNAKIIADKFHVIRLPNRLLDLYRNKIFKAKKLKLRTYLLMNSKKMDYWKRKEFQRELSKYPELNEIYWVKEAIHRLYRCRGKNKAKRSLIKLMDHLATSKIKELKSLRKTLMSWKEEILNYFENRLTNARTEGFNTVCKQLQKRAYGYKNFANYRLKVLYACS